MWDAEAKVKTVEAFFEDRRFAIPTYQRAYAWPDTHIRLLVDDLVRCWQQGGLSLRDEGEYFLGMIVTSAGEEPNAPLRLVDGQQRTTTLILLLKVLAETGTSEVRERINALLDPTPQNFVMAVPGFRDAVTKAAAESPAPRKARKETTDMARLAEAYRIIDDRVQSAIGDDADEIADFAEWVLQHVFVVDLLDTSPFDDQTLFDRVNTRGFPLTGADVFRSRVTMQVSAWQKGGFLQNWKDARSKAALAYGLNPTSAGLEAERLAMMAWLAGRHGRGDFEKTKTILKEPYEWAHVNLPQVAHGEERVPELFKKDFFPFVDSLEEIVAAQRTFSRDFAGFYSASLLKVPLIDALAAAVMKPGKKTNWKTDLQIVSRFLDCMAIRSAWGKGWCQTHGQKLEKICEAIGVASRNTGDNLSGMLRGLLAESPTFSPEDAPTLSKTNKVWIRYFLCRLTDHFERTVKGKDDLTALFGAGAKPEIEHVMANYHDFQSHFPNSAKWKEDRERLGALVILPKRLNASLRDGGYDRKVQAYAAQNSLAASLSSAAYNGKLHLRGAKPHHPFSTTPHRSMTAETIAERTNLYCKIAEHAWPKSLGLTKQTGTAAYAIGNVQLEHSAARASAI